MNRVVSSVYVQRHAKAPGEFLHEIRPSCINRPTVVWWRALTSDFPPNALLFVLTSVLYPPYPVPPLSGLSSTPPLSPIYYSSVFELVFINCYQAFSPKANFSYPHFCLISHESPCSPLRLTMDLALISCFPSRSQNEVHHVTKDVVDIEDSTHTVISENTFTGAGGRMK